MMFWTMGFRQRVKSAMLLVAVFGVIILSNVWEKNSMTDLNKNFSSIYEDRLLPSTYIFHLTDKLYEKRLALEHLADNPVGHVDEVEQQLALHNSAIDTLVENFESTYLVAEESASLHRFEDSYEAYNLEEHRLIEKIRNGGDVHQDLLALETTFYLTKNELTRLSSIQINIGKDLTTGSEHKFASVSLMNTFEITLMVILAFIIEFLVLGTRDVRPDPKKFRLN
ncbi:MCP four helix bundle domain-containing protein [Halocola ammonii]